MKNIINLLNFHLKKNKIIFNLSFFLFLISLNSYLRGFTFSFSTIDWDEITYLIMGKSILEGYIPFRDYWDLKPIGSYLIFSLFILILDYSVETIRYFSLLFVSLGSFGLFIILRKFNFYVAVLIGIVYSFFMVFMSSGLSGNTEIFFIPFQIFGLYFLMKKKYNHIFLGSFLLGIAFSIKYIVIFDSLVILSISLIFQFMRLKNKNILSVFKICLPYIGFAIPFLLSAYYFVYNDAWSTFSEYIKIVGSQYGQKTSFVEKIKSIDILNPFITLLLILILITFFLQKKKPYLISKLFIYAFCWLIFSIIGATWTGYYFEHYYLSVIPSMLILFGYLFIHLRKRIKLNSTIFRILFIVILSLFIYKTIKARSAFQNTLINLPDTSKLIYEDLKGKKNPKIFVANGIHSIYVLLNQLPPVKIVQPVNYLDKSFSQKMNIDGKELINQLKAKNISHILWCDENILNKDIESFPDTMNIEYIYSLKEWLIQDGFYIYKSYFPNCIIYEK